MTDRDQKIHSKNSFDDFGPEYQQQLIHEFITDKRFGQSIAASIKAEFFKDPAYSFIVKNIIRYYEKHDVIPNYDVLAPELRINMNHDNTFATTVLDSLNVIRKTEFVNPNIKSTAIKFCNLMALRDHIDAVKFKIDRGEISEYETISEGFKKILIEEHHDESINVFDNIELALNEEDRNAVPTGVDAIDLNTKGGLGKGEVALLIAPTGVGKALPNSHRVLSKSGWVLNGELKVGDTVIGSDGKPTNVIGVYPQGKRDIYKITFTDNTSSLCDIDHLWSVNTNNMRTRKTRKNGVSTYEPNNGFITLSTREMIGNVKTKNGRFNFRLPTVKPVELDEKLVNIHPYLIGLYLGDGCSSNNTPHIITSDYEIVEHIKSISDSKIIISESDGRRDGYKTLYKVKLIDVENYLTDLGIFSLKSNDKFIPSIYLTNSLNNRVELLQGLLDSDGYVAKNGTIQYTSVSKKLILGVRELVLSLGGSVSNIKSKVGTYSTNDGEIVNCSEAYTITLSFPDTINFNVCKLSRKLSRVRLRSKYKDLKFVKSIEYHHEEEATCIMVDNEDHLYVIDDYVVTHNTTLLSKIANSGQLAGKNILQIFFEDKYTDIQRKHLSCYSGIPLSELKNNETLVIERAREVQKQITGNLVLHKFPAEGVTMSKIKALIKKVKASGIKLDLVIVDYLECILPSGGNRDGEEWVGEGRIMRQFETICEDEEVGGWIATQGTKLSTNIDVVKIEHMGGNIKKAQIGHFIMGIAKPLELREAGKANISILKNRLGPDGMIYHECEFDNDAMRISTGESNTLLGFANIKQDNIEAIALAAIKKSRSEGDAVYDEFFTSKSDLELKSLNTEINSDSGGAVTSDPPVTTNTALPPKVKLPDIIKLTESKPVVNQEVKPPQETRVVNVSEDTVIKQSPPTQNSQTLKGLNSKGIPLRVLQKIYGNTT